MANIIAMEKFKIFFKRNSNPSTTEIVCFIKSVLKSFSHECILKVCEELDMLPYFYATVLTIRYETTYSLLDNAEYQRMFNGGVNLDELVKFLNEVENFDLIGVYMYDIFRKIKSNLLIEIIPDLEKSISKLGSKEVLKEYIEVLFSTKRYDLQTFSLHHDSYSSDKVFRGYDASLLFDRLIELKDKDLIFELLGQGFYFIDAERFHKMLFILFENEDNFEDTSHIDIMFSRNVKENILKARQSFADKKYSSETRIKGGVKLNEENSLKIIIDTTIETGNVVVCIKVLEECYKEMEFDTCKKLINLVLDSGSKEEIDWLKTTAAYKDFKVLSDSRSALNLSLENKN